MQQIMYMYNKTNANLKCVYLPGLPGYLYLSVYTLTQYLNTVNDTIGIIKQYSKNYTGPSQ